VVEEMAMAVIVLVIMVAMFDGHSDDNVSLTC
jgi:hypothetical protein